MTKPHVKDIFLDYLKKCALGYYEFLFLNCENHASDDEDR